MKRPSTDGFAMTCGTLLTMFGGMLFMTLNSSFWKSIFLILAIAGFILIIKTRLEINAYDKKSSKEYEIRKAKLLTCPKCHNSDAITYTITDRDIKEEEEKSNYFGIQGGSRETIKRTYTGSIRYIEVCNYCSYKSNDFSISIYETGGEETRGSKDGSFDKHSWGGPPSDTFIDYQIREDMLQRKSNGISS